MAGKVIKADMDRSARELLGFLERNLEEEVFEYPFIRANAAYLELVPERPTPWASACDVSRYSFGGCVVYAGTLSRLTGLPAVTITAVRTRPGVEMRGGGFHDAVMHPDGTLEDIWGRFPVERIAARYGILDWELSPEPHARMVADALRDRPGAEADVEEAMRVAEGLRR